MKNKFIIGLSMTMCLLTLFTACQSNDSESSSPTAENKVTSQNIITAAPKATYKNNNNNTAPSTNKTIKAEAFIKSM